MAQWETGEDFRRGGILQSGMGLAVLGVGAALVGAFIVGPVLKAKDTPAPTRQATADARRPRFDDLPGEDAIRGEIERAAARARRQLADEVERAIAEPKRSKPRAEAKPPAEDEQPAETPDDEVERAEPVRVRETTGSGERSTKSAPQSREPERPADRPAEEVTAESTPRRTAPAATAPRSLRPESASPRATPVPTPVAALRSTRPDSRERTQVVVPVTKSPSRAAAPAPAPATAAASAPTGGPVYRIRTGQFESRTAADETRARLAATGIPATVVKRGEGFTVLAGSYKQKENADRVVDLLRQQQLGAEITVR